MNHARRVDIEEGNDRDAERSDDQPHHTVILFINVTGEWQLNTRFRQQKQHARHTRRINLSTEQVIFDEDGENRLNQSKAGHEKDIGDQQQLGHTLHKRCVQYSKRVVRRARIYVVRADAERYRSRICGVTTLKNDLLFS